MARRRGAAAAAALIAVCASLVGCAAQQSLATGFVESKGVLARRAAAARRPPAAEDILVSRKFAAKPLASRVPDEHIILTSADVRPVLSRHLRGARVKTVFTGLPGFSGAAVQGRLTNATLRALLADPRVSLVEEVSVVSALGGGGGGVAASAIQASPPWNLDRIDERDLPLDGKYSFSSCTCPLKAGNGTWIYVIDTGVRRTHADFGGRGRTGAFWPYPGVDSDLDLNGHGTHVAGTAASRTYGVAKAALVVPVKVLDDSGSGTNDAVAAGIAWALSDPRPGSNALKVLSMSLGGPRSEALDAAVYSAYLAGAVVVAAAGNDGADACGTSPAGARGALAVGATTRTDARAAFSNFGTCVALFAPGNDVPSLSHLSDTSTAPVVLSGTSMAAPAVAGVAARVIASGACARGVEANDCVADRLLADATRGRVSDRGPRSPNRLLFRAATVA
ncbi:Extracellular serine proteinase [Scenedesmus sp. PABB004]|nr:Extracellular serine proteinase [Scenedesmus sp. PABB004]